MDPLIIALVSALGATASGVVSLLQQRRRERGEAKDGEAAAGDRIETLIRSLNSANDVIREIEGEIRTRQELAEKLQADAEQAERLLELNREQLEAVRGLVGSELRRESKRSFWLGALVNFLFFLAGVGLTLLLH